MIREEPSPAPITYPVVFPWKKKFAWLSMRINEHVLWLEFFEQKEIHLGHYDTVFIERHPIAGISAWRETSHWTQGGGGGFYTEHTAFPLKNLPEEVLA
jgi:hypothetical protein